MSWTLKSRAIVFALLAVVVPFGFSHAQLSAKEHPQVIRDVTYVERGDLELKADIYEPSGEGPFPAVLVVHGGAWRSGGKTQMSFVAQRLVASGYVAVAIAYRLAPDHKFPAQIEDCKSAVRWMRTHAAEYKIDPNQIAGWGYSAGGHLVALLGTTDAKDGLEGPDVEASSPSTRLQAVIAGGAPCDFRAMAPNVGLLAYWLGGTRSEKPEVYHAASPRSFVTADDPPIFFYHGNGDTLVDIASPKGMMQDLETAGVPTGLYMIPEANHIQAIFDAPAGKEAMAFLDKYLKHAGEAAPTKSPEETAKSAGN